MHYGRYGNSVFVKLVLELVEHVAVISQNANSAVAMQARKVRSDEIMTNPLPFWRMQIAGVKPNPVRDMVDLGALVHCVAWRPGFNPCVIGRQRCCRSVLAQNILGSRLDNEGSRRQILGGYASVFNSPTDIGGWWTEVIAPGAFASQVNEDVRALVDHDSGRVIGRTKSGTLRLSEDERGLRVEIDVPNTTNGNDLWVLVERGDISGMSFGFRVTKEMWDDTIEPPKRTIMAVELHEVSAVAFPAYDDTNIGVDIGKRSLDALRAESGAREAEEKRRKENAEAAKRRITERAARSEQIIRGIPQDAT